MNRKYHLRHKNHSKNGFYGEDEFYGSSHWPIKNIFENGFYGVYERMVFTFSWALCYKP